MMTSKMSSPSRMLQLRRATHRNQQNPEMYKVQERAEAANLSAVQQFHPLTGLRSAYYVCMSERIEDITSPIRRFFIRLVYFKWSWYSGRSVHDMGIFTDRDVAEDIAARKQRETGKSWSVKELPVNGLLPDMAVQYGFYSFPDSKVDHRYRNRVVKFAAIPKNDLEQLAEVESKLGHLENCIEGKCERAI